MAKWFDGPAVIPLTPDYLEDRILSYSRAGYPKAKWMGMAERLLQENFTVLLYEDKPAKWRHFRVTRPGNDLQIKVGMFYGEGNPPLVSHDCNIICASRGTTPAEAIATILRAFKPDVQSLDFIEIVKESRSWGE